MTMIRRLPENPEAAAAAVAVAVAAAVAVAVAVELPSLESEIIFALKHSSSSGLHGEHKYC